MTYIYNSHPPVFQKCLVVLTFHIVYGIIYSIQQHNLVSWCIAGYLQIIMSTEGKLCCCMMNKPCRNRRKGPELWTAVLGLLALISRAYHSPISRHHEL